LKNALSEKVILVQCFQIISTEIFKFEETLGFGNFVFGVFPPPPKKKRKYGKYFWAVII